MELSDLLSRSLVPSDAPSRWLLEDEAERLIMESLDDFKAKSGPRSYLLTRAKTKDRYRREVYVGAKGYGVVNGPGNTPDAAIRHGMFHRAINTRQTWLNSRTPRSSAHLIPRGQVVTSGRYPEWRIDDGLVHPVIIKRPAKIGP